MKRAYLTHGWSGSPEGGFLSWLRAELEKRGYRVEAPEMPDADEPLFEKWVPALEALVGAADEEALLVGHSMGGQAVLRYLERLPEGARVGTAILVAPVVETIKNMTPEHAAVARSWLDRPFDTEKIKRAAARLVGIFSDDDPHIPLSSEAIVREQFGGETVVLAGRGHFSGDEGCADLPEILNYL